jgi:radical SAM superfamily enzyme
MEDTVRLLAGLKVDGVKFHHQYIVENTELNRLYRAGKYRPITQQDYVEMVAWALANLPKSTVIQRLTGDPPMNLLVAPDWSFDKIQTIAMIHNMIKNI